MENRVNVGKNTDSLEKLEQLCNEKAEQMAGTMNIDDELEVSFWTDDIPELICIGTFAKEVGGKISYKLDFSQSTL